MHVKYPDWRVGQNTNPTVFMSLVMPVLDVIFALNRIDYKLKYDHSTTCSILTCNAYAFNKSQNKELLDKMEEDCFLESRTEHQEFDMTDTKALVEQCTPCQHSDQFIVCSQASPITICVPVQQDGNECRYIVQIRYRTFMENTLRTQRFICFLDYHEEVVFSQEKKIDCEKNKHAVLWDATVGEHNVVDLLREYIGTSHQCNNMTIGKLQVALLLDLHETVKTTTQESDKLMIDWS